MKNKKSNLQIIGSTLVILTGLFVMAAIANKITGSVIGNYTSIRTSDIIIAFWGLLITAVGIWMIRKKDFHKSIFD